MSSHHLTKPVFHCCNVKQPTSFLIYGHELWVVTETIRLWVQDAEKGYFQMVVIASDIQDILRVELPQLKLLAFDQDASCTPHRWGVSTCPTGRRPQGRPTTRWRGYVSWLAWEYLCIPVEELEAVAGEREVWASLLSAHSGRRKVVQNKTKKREKKAYNEINLWKEPQVISKSF